MILRPHAPRTRALPTELHPDISVTTGSRTQMVSLPSELKSDASRQFRHSDISLSVQQSTVFPICQYPNTCSFIHELVAPPRFELGIKTRFELVVSAVPPWSHIAGLSRLSAPLRAFSEEENVLITHYQAYQRYP